MARKRTSLRDRNREAIAGQPMSTGTEEPPASSSATPSQERESTTPKPVTPEGRRPRPAATGTTDTARVGIYFRAGLFHDTRAAYLADWLTGGEADTLAKWVAHALDAHAARSTDERAALALPNGRQETQGDSRSFTLPASTLARVQGALVDDQHAGRWNSLSSWCGEAIHAAVVNAKVANGGTLPTPPARLPNRLTR